MEQDGAIYLRGRVSKIYEDEGKLIVKGADTLSGNQVEIAADMVVLATGVIPKKGSDKLAQMLGISYDKYGFFTESHPKLRPAESSTAGIFLAGMAQGPRDIPESVVSGSAAASKILGLFSKNEYEVYPSGAWKLYNSDIVGILHSACSRKVCSAVCTPVTDKRYYSRIAGVAPLNFYIVMVLAFFFYIFIFHFRKTPSFTLL